MSASKRILIAGSLPIAPPWNGADKNIARILAAGETAHSIVLQTAPGAGAMHWQCHAHVRPHLAHYRRDVPSVQSIWESARFVASHGPRVDLIHIVASVGACRSPALMMPGILRRFSRVPILHTAPAVALPVHPRVAHLADLTVVFSEHTRRQLREQGVRNVVRMYPPVDLDALARPGSVEMLRDTLQLGPCPLLYAGHYGPHSGIEEALGAFARVCELVPDATLVLACRPHAHQDRQEEARRVRAQAMRAGIGTRVRVLDQVTDMAALILACVATILVPIRLHLKMDLPLVLLESLALARPIIVSDRPPLNEVALGEGGVLVPPGHPDALRHAMLLLLANPALRDRMGLTGQQEVLRLCDPARIVSAYQACYAHLWQPRNALHVSPERIEDSYS